MAVCFTLMPNNSPQIAIFHSLFGPTYSLFIIMSFTFLRILQPRTNTCTPTCIYNQTNRMLLRSHFFSKTIYWTKKFSGRPPPNSRKTIQWINRRFKLIFSVQQINILYRIHHFRRQFSSSCHIRLSNTKIQIQFFHRFTCLYCWYPQHNHTYYNK